MYTQNSISLPFKKILSLSLAVLFLFSNLSAQSQPKKSKPDKKAKIEELRKKFFNDKLALTDTEKKGFWPLYDEYKQKEKTLRDSFKSKYKPNSVVFMDDKQAEEFLNATIKLNDDQNALFKEYIAKFRKVIPIKKVAMLPMLEKEFKKEMLNKSREHQKQGAPGKQGQGQDDE